MFLLALMRKERLTGVLTVAFVIWYSAARLITDFLRVANRFFGLTGSQWSCVCAIALSLVVLARIRRRARRPENEAESPATVPAAGGSSPDPG